MRAICVKLDRSLEVRDIPMPTTPPADHMLVDIEACAINHVHALCCLILPEEVDPLAYTRVGEKFSMDRIEDAMRFEAVPGAKAVLIS